MKNCLILLTNYYPYYKGEEYLEAEINYLSTNFDKIIVIPTMVSKNMEINRTLPKNADIVPINIDLSLIGKIKIFFKQYRNIINDLNKKQIIEKDAKNKFNLRLYCYYFEARAMEVYKELIKKLNNFDFNKYKSITIYSYWLYITARVAVELKNDYFKEYIKCYTFSRAHGYDINEYVNPLNYLPQREFLLENLDNIFPVSSHGVDYLNSKYPGYEKKIEVRRLGTKKIERKENVSSKCFHIVSCSTVRKLKRLDKIVNALSILKENKVNFKWYHIGNGPDFKKIKKLAERKLDKKQFLFLGYMKNEDVLKWYQENPGTVFINTSESEGVPVSIMEAMSMGFPIIATDVGGTREIVKNNITGILLNSDCTPNEVAEAIMKIYYLDHFEYTEMSRASKELWEERCNADKLYSEFSKEILLNSLFIKGK